MVQRKVWSRVFLAAMAVAGTMLCATSVWAQAAPGGGDGTPNTIGTSGTSGVSVDAEGVLKREIFQDPTGELSRRRFAEARASLDKSMAKSSKLRKISLTRLEAEVARALESGDRPSDVMKYLAGLTRIEYVFYYPESKDIVIAGPAEPFGQDLSGRVIGLESGRPVLELQDLVVALRAFSADGAKARQVFCSIDPTEEGLVRLNQFLSKVGSTFSGPPNQRVAQFLVTGLKDSLGLQTVTVGGISPKTHFAQVMVEADYRMKLIGIGLEQPPVKLASYVSIASASTVARNAMQRWYFVPDYECVRVSEDRLAMQLVGDGVKLVGEDEVVKADGSRTKSAVANPASDQFVNNFTRVYPELAAKSPVYAQLRNLIDMLVAAAYIQDQDLYGQAGWKMPLFGNEEYFPVETLNAPKKAATAVNAIFKGKRLLTPLGGGVSIEATRALQSDVMLEDEDGQVAEARSQVKLQNLAPNQWWWD